MCNKQQQQRHSNVLHYTTVAVCTQLHSWKGAKQQCQCLSCRLLHPDSPAHEGYPVVPPVLRLLTGLKQVELHVSSGHNAQLEAAAAVPDVQLVLTLARHEQVPFSR